MVSDYKFHLFCKCLKKEKWRFSKDLSSAMMLLIFHCCLWTTQLWEPNVGCIELSGRILLCHEKIHYPYGHHYRVPVLQTLLLTVFMGCKMQLTFTKREIIISGEGKAKTSECVWEIPFPLFKCQEKYQRNCFLGKTQGFK